MRPNATQLSVRDPALAALLGLIPGADFGGESLALDAGADFGADFGYNDFSPVGVDMDPSMGADFGSFEWAGEQALAAYGADFGAARAPAAPPSAAQFLAMQKTISTLQAQMKAKAAKTAQRGSLLEPNKGSNVKIERYSFGLSQALVVGTAAAIVLAGNPSVDIRPQRICTNVPGPNYVFLTLIQVANVVVTVGTGVEDASDYANVAVATMLDLPTLSTQTPARVTGNYFGFVPASYVVGSATFFTTSFKGWANVTA
jgi:hypothetical protein